jgi:hypothetical protein
VRGKKTIKKQKNKKITSVVGKYMQLCVYFPTTCSFLCCLYEGSPRFVLGYDLQVLEGKKQENEREAVVSLVNG